MPTRTSCVGSFLGYRKTCRSGFRRSSGALGRRRSRAPSRAARRSRPEELETKNRRRRCPFGPCAPRRFCRRAGRLREVVKPRDVAGGITCMVLGAVTPPSDPCSLNQAASSPIVTFKGRKVTSSSSWARTGEIASGTASTLTPLPVATGRRSLTLAPELEQSCTSECEGDRHIDGPGTPTASNDQSRGAESNWMIAFMATTPAPKELATAKATKTDHLRNDLGLQPGGDRTRQPGSIATPE